MFSQRTSIHGRRLGISSTGGLISGTGSTGGASSAIEMAVQMWGKGMIETISSQEAVMSNSGISVVSSDLSGNSTLALAAPVSGVYKEVHFQTPATAITINTTATTIFINTTNAEGAAAGSTTVSITGTAAGVGGSLALRGLSDTVWGVVANVAGAST